MTAEDTMTKSYDELTFTDDFMFCKVLENNEEICREIIELVTGKRISRISSLQKQRTIELTPNGKGIRLDVIFEGDDKIYNIEMQNMTNEDLPRRSRYYQGILDLDMMERGKKYEELNDTTIIFICTFDPFGAGKSVYTLKQYIEEAPEIQYNDGTNKIFLSAEAPLSESITKEMRDFLDFVGGRSFKGDLSEKIQKAVNHAKSQTEWRKEYMFLQEKIDNAREEGLKEGREEGEKTGIIKSIIQMKKNGMSNAQIADIMEMSEEEIEAMIAENNS